MGHQLCRALHTEKFCDHISIPSLRQCANGHHDAPGKGSSTTCFPGIFHHRIRLSSNQTDECPLDSHRELRFLRIPQLTKFCKACSREHLSKLGNTLCRTVGSKLREFILFQNLVQNKNINRFRSSSEQICEGHIYHSLPRETSNDATQCPGKCHLASFYPATPLPLSGVGFQTVWPRPNPGRQLLGS